VQDFMADLYPWTKALHIIAVMAWMAGLLYLPRLYVYHCDAVIGSTDSERLKVMERKLLRAIMNPSMIAAYVFGTCLLLTPGIVDWSAGWIYLKLAAVVGMTGFHHVFSTWRKQFAEDKSRKQPRTYRMMNEGPAVLMILIVIMVVVRPF
jgi:putative membrane protein